MAKVTVKTLYSAKNPPTSHKELADLKCQSTKIENFSLDILYIFLTELKMAYIPAGLRSMFEKSTFYFNTYT